MYRVTCSQCGASVVTEDGNSDRLACPCCPEPHSHEANANDCPGAGLNHEGAGCAHPDPAACLAVTPAGEDCPGGHCHLLLDGCQVCRPCMIEFVGAGALTTVPVVVR
jgi:hypothetical protein